MLTPVYLGGKKLDVNWWVRMDNPLMKSVCSLPQKTPLSILMEEMAFIQIIEDLSQFEAELMLLKWFKIKPV